MTFRNQTRKTALALLPLVALLWVAGLCLACETAEVEGVVQTYHCPMHLDYVSDKPGDCPVCGMRLVPAPMPTATPAPMPTAVPPPVPAAVPGLSRVDVDEAGMHLSGIQTAVAVQRTLARTTRAVGLVTADETRIRHVHTKISGWVEKLYVSSTGQAVHAGQPLLTIYSQELLATQEEYLRAREAAARFAGSDLEEVRRGGADLVTAARRRLELFDVPRSLIAQLDRTGTAQRTVTLLAPSSGYVTGKEVFEGMEVQPGMDLLTVTDLSRVWVEADFYEYESSTLALGRKVGITSPYDPTARLSGRIAFVFPFLNPESRTIKVRVELPNPGLRLKPGMYVDVVSEVGSSDGVVVPDSAVIDTGVRQVVFVQTPLQGNNQGKASFEPRLVKVGSRGDGQALILEGIAAGESVAIRANFLLDSESRLRAAVEGMSGGHQHGGGTQ